MANLIGTTYTGAAAPPRKRILRCLNRVGNMTALLPLALLVLHKSRPIAAWPTRLLSYITALCWLMEIAVRGPLLLEVAASAAACAAFTAAKADVQCSSLL